jgi:hypothetical protein
VPHDHQNAPTAATEATAEITIRTTISTALRMTEMVSGDVSRSRRRARGYVILHKC